ncbi:hypothetical protein OKA04_06210 [Luteolibacter flavescens]|uniref:Chromosome partition protein Smc n=1 Tax=Luteolibacter flavescens TaxID=1859460 RepID=A0ABT3FLI5_9BACT|nr:hypothetical protein [Luteolibacter flavescens]MCW1884317.1 hypothetical protein [Luteolibacter flavescens]
MIVLGGFALLYFLVFDESMQGGKPLISSVIREQESIITSRKGEIESFRKKEEDAGTRADIAREVKTAERKVENEGSIKTELAQKIEATKAELVAIDEKWEAYKDQYRAQVWPEAQGKELKEFKTVSGRVYEDVKVLGVDHTGMRLMAHSGPVTVPAEELPDDLRDLYQLSDEKKKAILLAASQGTAVHEDNVEVAKLQQRIGELNTAIREKSDARKGAEDRLKMAVDAGPRFQIEISNQEGKINAERRKAVSRAPQMEQQLKQMRKKAEDTRNSIPKLQADIRKFDEDIAKLNAEVKTATQDIQKVRDAAKEKAAPANP